MIRPRAVPFADVIHEALLSDPCIVGIRVFGASLKMRREPPMELAEGFEPPTT
jgi:hypothetical protein